jgi:glycerophosphoryl diester phosphodiesterase
MIEADIWFRAGEIWVRHERRLGWLPLLMDRWPAGAHSAGPLALSPWRGYYIRPDIHELKLGELLDRVAGKKRLLLDVKGRKGDEAEAFASTLGRRISEGDHGESVAICGQFWPVLGRLRKAAPHLEARYSVEKPYQWEAFLRLVDGHQDVRKVCIEHRFMDQDKARFLEDSGVDVYCWTVDDAAEAEQLVARGVEGIISNDLGLLGALGGS